jgi:hypothetical protein
VTRLCEGQRASVLQMPAAAAAAQVTPEAADERLLALVE